MLKMFALLACIFTAIEFVELLFQNNTLFWLLLLAIPQCPAVVMVGLRKIKSRHIVPSVCPMHPLTAPDMLITSALRVPVPAVLGMGDVATGPSSPWVKSTSITSPLTAIRIPIVPLATVLATDATCV
jgi:hypothetical protein